MCNICVKILKVIVVFLQFNRWTEGNEAIYYQYDLQRGARYQGDQAPQLQRHWTTEIYEVIIRNTER